MSIRTEEPHLIPTVETEVQYQAYQAPSKVTFEQISNQSDDLVTPTSPPPTLKQCEHKTQLKAQKQKSRYYKDQVVELKAVEGRASEKKIGVKNQQKEGPKVTF